jgi:hypothetical protein
MAISTLDGVIAGVQPPVFFYKTTSTMEAAFVMHSLLYTAGIPGAGVAPSDVANGVSLNSYSGQIPFPTGNNNTYMIKAACGSSITGSLMIMDRLWHNATLSATTTTAQTINSVAFPARDNNGSSNGEGVFIALEVSGATTNATATTTATITYTNSAGTGSKTGTIASIPGTAVAGTFIPVQLAAGDIGVRSIQSLTLGNSLAAGTIHLVAYRPLAVIDNIGAGLVQSLDMTQLGFPRLYDNTVPTLAWLPSATTAASIMGQIVFTQG